MESTPSIKEYVSEKLKKAKKYLNEPIEANVVLSTEKFRHTVEVSVSANNGVVVNGVESQEDMYAAIDAVIDKVERQIKRSRDKVKRSKGKNYQFKMHVLTSQVEDEGSERGIVKTTTYPAKPMSVEEALEQLQATKNDFVIFTNATTQAVNVVYCRKDGNYGLIEPE
jgi:putative sigma-54 modulation protein